METKQQSQATTIENLKSETGWEFTVLLIKKTECTSYMVTMTNMLLVLVRIIGLIVLQKVLNLVPNCSSLDVPNTLFDRLVIKWYVLYFKNHFISNLYLML